MGTSLKWVILCSLALPALLLAVPPGTVEDITERIRFPGRLCEAGQSCAAAPVVTNTGGPLSGTEVYNRFCFACHATGVSQAPRLGDSAAWQLRLDKGINTLYAATISGLGLMPPKGTCISCSEEELRAAVDYMLGESR